MSSGWFRRSNFGPPVDLADHLSQRSTPTAPTQRHLHGVKQENIPVIEKLHQNKPMRHIEDTILLDIVKNHPDTFKRNCSTETEEKFQPESGSQPQDDNTSDKSVTLVSNADHARKKRVMDLIHKLMRYYKLEKNNFDAQNMHNLLQRLMSWQGNPKQMREIMLNDLSFFEEKLLRLQRKHGWRLIDIDALKDLQQKLQSAHSEIDAMVATAESSDQWVRDDADERARDDLLDALERWQQRSTCAHSPMPDTDHEEILTDHEIMRSNPYIGSSIKTECEGDSDRTSTRRHRRERPYESIYIRSRRRRRESRSRSRSSRRHSCSRHRWHRRSSTPHRRARSRPYLF